MLEVHVIYIYVQYILIDLVKLWKDSANSSNIKILNSRIIDMSTGISGLESCTISMPVKQRSVMGPVSWKPLKAHKAIFSLSVSKNGEVYMPQTSSIYKGNFCSF